MAKKKEFESTVSVAELSKYVKENAPVAKEVDAGEMKILVKPFVGAVEFAEIVQDVVEGSFDWDDETGELVYYPYFTSFLTDMKIIDKFTNIRLPQSYEERYEIIRVLDHNGVIDMIKNAIDPSVMIQLEAYIGKAIDFEKGKSARAANQSIIYMGQRLRALGLSAHDVLNKLDSLADALGDEEAVNGFIKSIKEEFGKESSDEVTPEIDDEKEKYLDGERVIPIRERK